MHIPLSGPDITDKEIQAVLSVLKTPYLSLGPKLTEFEERIADYVGVKYAIAVNSGTSALHLVIRSFDIKDGDEVITTPFSFIASANCLLFERAKPVFVDINPDTLNINADRIEEKITSRTKAILAVDIFGYPADWNKLREMAQRFNLALIEDSCEAFGAEYKDKKVGSLGDVGCFAFYPNKQVTTGEGGMIVTNDENIYKLLKSMRNQGREDNDEWLQHKRLGYSYRISDINCALGIAQMERIEEILAKRERIAKIYNEKLKNLKEINLPPESTEDIKRSWFVYVIKLDDKYTQQDRDNILNGLQKKDISCANYFTPIHLQPFYADMFGYKKGEFPITEAASERTIALPFYNNLKEEEIDCVAESLKELL